MPPEPSESHRIGVRLDELLYQRRMTLTELADRIGITLANLSILKTGKAKAIRFSTLEAICRELDCQPGDLLVCERNEEEGPADRSEQQRDHDQDDDQRSDADGDVPAHAFSPLAQRTGGFSGWPPPSVPGLTGGRFALQALATAPCGHPSETVGGLKQTGLNFQPRRGNEIYERRCLRGVLLLKRHWRSSFPIGPCLRR